MMALVAVSFGCGGCQGGAADAEQPKAEVFVLVDLSETWHSPATARRNERLLAEVGEGIAAQAGAMEPPIAVQHRVIGQGSLGREPICDAVYSPSMIAILRKQADYMVTKLSKLKRYLGVDCPALIVRQPPEPLTEISAALASVAETPAGPRVRRYIIILSDFREETVGAPAPTPDLSRFKILLVYRPLSDDQKAPADLENRVESWRDKLAKRNARVTTAPDTALKRTTIAAFVARR